MKKSLLLLIMLLLFTTNLVPMINGEIIKTRIDTYEKSEIRYWAVIVGIADYYGVKNDLPVTKRHLSLLHDTLVSTNNWEKNHVKLILNEDATKEGILNGLNWLIRNSDVDDIVVFSFQGHGSSVDDEDGDESDGKDEGIVPWEGKKGFITDDQLDEIFSNINCTGMMLIFHSCLSGGLIDKGRSLIFDKSNAFANGFSSDIEGNGRVVLMSSMDQGLALAFPSLTRQVAYGLKGYADGDIKGEQGFGVISAEEISLYAKKQVQTIFILVFLIFPPVIISFLISEFIAKIRYGYWFLPVPQIYDGYDGELVIAELLK
ncbi:MAG: caspase family protein [Petrotogales bacterium]